MIQLRHYCCPQCGKKHDDSGRLGTSRQCGCGAWIPYSKLDCIRFYWIFQTSIAFGGATFFFAWAFFYQELPNDPFERLLSPLLQVPTLITILVSYGVLIRHKRTCDNDYLILRYFLWGIGLMIFCFLSVLMVAMLGRTAL
jgi:hypothetical protein